MIGIISKAVKPEEALKMINRFISSSLFGEASTKEKELLVRIKQELKKQINNKLKLSNDE